MFFSPDTIDSIPKSHIFSDKIICLLCTYSTKVRSNLVLHLNGHKNGQYVTKEIVNPVPSIGKSELMFDKMINLSASSFDAMNTDKVTFFSSLLFLLSNYFVCISLFLQLVILVDVMYIKT